MAYLGVMYYGNKFNVFLLTLLAVVNKWTKTINAHSLWSPFLIPITSFKLLSHDSVTGSPYYQYSVE